MPVILQTTILLVLSNVFMTFAWYAHLKDLNGKPWFIAALVSWGVALAEYLLQVPANRIGYTQLSLGQLKILQEAIALSVFVPFAVFYMRDAQARLPLGRPVHRRRRVLHVSRGVSGRGRRTPADMKACGSVRGRRREARSPECPLRTASPALETTAAPGEIPMNDG